MNNRGVPCRGCRRPSATGECPQCAESPRPAPVERRRSSAWRIGIRTFVRPLAAMGGAAMWQEERGVVWRCYRWEWEDGARADEAAYGAAVEGGVKPAVSDHDMDARCHARDTYFARADADARLRCTGGSWFCLDWNRLVPYAPRFCASCAVEIKRRQAPTVEWLASLGITEPRRFESWRALDCDFQRMYDALVEHFGFKHRSDVPHELTKPLWDLHWKERDRTKAIVAAKREEQRALQPATPKAPAAKAPASRKRHPRRPDSDGFVAPEVETIPVEPVVGPRYAVQERRSRWFPYLRTDGTSALMDTEAVALAIEASDPQHAAWLAANYAPRRRPRMVGGYLSPNFSADGGDAFERTSCGRRVGRVPGADEQAEQHFRHDRAAFMARRLRRGP